MFCLFVLVILTSSIIGEGTVLCYKGTAYRTVQNSNDTCSSLGLEQVNCEACFSKGMTTEPTGNEKIPVNFGCKEDMVDNTKTVQPEGELTYICDKDLCNCFD